MVLDDGRKLCLECLDSVIMDTNECQPLYIEIREFYEGLNMKIEQEIPLLLVERQALNEAMEGEKQVKDPCLLLSHSNDPKLSCLLYFSYFLLFPVRAIITYRRQEVSASQKNRLCTR